MKTIFLLCRVKILQIFVKMTKIWGGKENRQNYEDIEKQRILF